MAKNLLIVESPAKAKTIEKYLGEDFKVEASYGHIRDLPKGDRAVDVPAGFLPQYEVPADKAEVVNKLKKLVKQAEQVWLATDEDREGEAISWHLAQVLGLDVQRTPRITFNEITQQAIRRAVDNPRTIDMRLVEAQQARRVLDRLVGFELSPILWKKVKYGLSAGRVQSVALRLIVEREREIIKHVAQAYFQVQAQARSAQGKPFTARLPKNLNTLDLARALLQGASGSQLLVTAIETKPSRRSPAAPFTTSTLQQEAGRKLSYSVSQTMRLAQNLYEAGHITYMRTDSVALSQTALQAAKEVIVKDFGPDYHQVRTFKGKIANAQEAHEAIRPTDMGRQVVTEDRQQQRLYDLIRKRTLASQMADARLERTVVDLAFTPARPATDPYTLQATGEVIQFEGFLKLYLEGQDEDENDENGGGLLPALAVGDVCPLVMLTATERFTRHAPRYTEASLVKRLEELGIGRPSTYAPTLGTIQQRGYVVREDRPGTERRYRVLTLKGTDLTESTETENHGAEKAKLFPEDLGMLVSDFLVDHFPDVVDYSFTARLEENFDDISRGEMKWDAMLQGFYPSFHQKVQHTEETADRASGERPLGTDPTSGKAVLARLGRYGPIVQIGAADDPQKRFAPLRAGQHLETVSLEEALELFQLPRIVGKYEDLPLKANVGRFGPYLQHADKFYSLPKGVDPIGVSLEEAIQIVENKRQADRDRVLRRIEGTDWQILNGRWGPYLQAGALNVRLPKGSDPQALALEELQALVAKAQTEPARGRKKVAAKAPPKSAKARTAPKKKPRKKTPAPAAELPTGKTAVSKGRTKKA